METTPRSLHRSPSSGESSQASLRESLRRWDLCEEGESSSALSSVSPPHRDPSRWQCHLCTFLNPVSHEKCQMCDTPRSPVRGGKRRATAGVSSSGGREEKDAGTGRVPVAGTDNHAEIATRHEAHDRDVRWECLECTRNSEEWSTCGMCHGARPSLRTERDVATVRDIEPESHPPLVPGALVTPKTSSWPSSSSSSSTSLVRSTGPVKAKPAFINLADSDSENPHNDEECRVSTKRKKRKRSSVVKMLDLDTKTEEEEGHAAVASSREEEDDEEMDISHVPFSPVPQATRKVLRAKRKKKKNAAKTTEYNEAVRRAKELKKSGKLVAAIKEYKRALDMGMASKKERALREHIEHLQDRAFDRDLHKTAEALVPVSTASAGAESGTPCDAEWLYNVITALYHLRVRSEEDGFVVGDERPDFLLDADVFDRLYDYQRDGVAFLWRLYGQRSGGILADDMGLGKTIQLAAFVTGLFWTKQAHHVLVVVPASLVDNWLQELREWCGSEVRVKRYHKGGGRSRRKVERALDSVVDGGGVAVTTYDMVVNNENRLKATRWDLLVLDEGHMIKNHKTKRFKALRALNVKHCHRVMLSGTVVQNNLTELWALFDFVCEGELFGTLRDFKHDFAAPINEGRNRDADAGTKAAGLAASERLKDAIEPFMLRRTKEGVIERKREREVKEKEDSTGKEDETSSSQMCGPSFEMRAKKRELVVWVKITDVQKRVYEQFLGSETVRQLLNTTKSPLAALMVMKKICDHPFLLHTEMKMCTELTELSSLCEDKSVANSLVCSAKMNVMCQILQEHQRHGKRTLVFAGMKKTLNLIVQVLDDRCIPHMRMDGDTGSEERQALVDDFNTNHCPVFLLTTKVGSLGLNLVGANRVIIFEPDWNPANDSQAVDRAYRIGQSQDVMVFRLVTCGTIEEKRYRRQIYKTGLLKTVTRKANQQRYFSRAERADLFSLGKVEISETQETIGKVDDETIELSSEFDAEKKKVQRIDSVADVSYHDLLFSVEKPLSDEMKQALKDLTENHAQTGGASRKARGTAQKTTTVPIPKASPVMTSFIETLSSPGVNAWSYVRDMIGWSGGGSAAREVPDTPSLVATPQSAKVVDLSGGTPPGTDEDSRSSHQSFHSFHSLSSSRKRKSPEPSMDGESVSPSHSHRSKRKRLTSPMPPGGGYALYPAPKASLFQSFTPKTLSQSEPLTAPGSVPQRVAETSSAGKRKRSFHSEPRNPRNPRPEKRKDPRICEMTKVLSHLRLRRPSARKRSAANFAEILSAEHSDYDDDGDETETETYPGFHANKSRSASIAPSENPSDASTITDPGVEAYLQSQRVTDEVHNTEPEPEAENQETKQDVAEGNAVCARCLAREAAAGREVSKCLCGASTEERLRFEDLVVNAETLKHSEPWKAMELLMKASAICDSDTRIHRLGSFLAEQLESTM